MFCEFINRIHPIYNNQSARSNLSLIFNLFKTINNRSTDIWLIKTTSRTNVSTLLFTIWWTTIKVISVIIITLTIEIHSISTNLRTSTLLILWKSRLTKWALSRILTKNTILCALNTFSLIFTWELIYGATNALIIFPVTMWTFCNTDPLIILFIAILTNTIFSIKYNILFSKTIILRYRKCSPISEILIWWLWYTITLILLITKNTNTFPISHLHI